MDRVLKDDALHQEWKRAISLIFLDSPPEDTITISTGKAVMLKILHAIFKEFTQATRTLEILTDGKSADVDVALRTKLKTHAAEKHVSIT